MSFIRMSSQRKYSNGGGMYVIQGKEGNLTYYAGSPRSAEDMAELVCRIVEQAGVELTTEDVEKIRDRLHLPPTDYPYTDKPDESEVEELLNNKIEDRFDMTKEQPPDLSGVEKTGAEDGER